MNERWAGVAIGILIAACAARALSQESAPPPRIGDQLALARVCASEVGIRIVNEASIRECAAIAAVLRGRSSGIESGARRYSGRVFDLERRDRRAYVAFLRPDGREPAHWPAYGTRGRRHAPWGAFRDRWLALYHAAGEIVQGRLEHACSSVPDHWGARYGVDLERARRAGWTEADCGETRNAFWLVR